MMYARPWLFLVLFATACSNPQQEAVRSGEAGLPDDFLAFYERFHRDSAFQMERIVWPLEGIPDNAGSRLSDTDFRWQPSTWKMMRPIEASGDRFDREFLPVSEDIIIEKITHRSGDYGLIRRFAVVGEEWHLIYYAGVNPLRK